MKRIIDDRRRRIWIERIVWNALAVTSLAFMIAVLLWSLRWLDAIDAVPSGELQAAPDRDRIEFDQRIEDAVQRVARVSGPRG